MDDIRKREKSCPPVPPLRDPDVWSDTSSRASVFKGPGVEILCGGSKRSDSAKRDPEYMAPEVKEVYSRIESLILEPTVQAACTHTFV